MGTGTGTGWAVSWKGLWGILLGVDAGASRASFGGGVLEPGAEENWPTGPNVGAIFDLDRTLVAGYTSIAFGRDLLRSGQLDLWAVQPELGMALRSGEDGDLGRYDRLMSVLASLMVGVKESRLRRIGAELFESEYERRLHPEGFELVERHRKHGHSLVLASAATAYQVEPIARALGISDVVCTRFATLGGRLSGDIERACWGEGKLDAVRAMASRRRFSLSDSFFYTDGVEDLPLLEAVGHPRPTNADASLARIARERGWRQQVFDDRSAPTAWELVRPLLDRRPRRGWRERLDQAVDEPIRSGYRAAHWLRRSLRPQAEGGWNRWKGR